MNSKEIWHIMMIVMVYFASYEAMQSVDTQRGSIGWYV